MIVSTVLLSPLLCDFIKCGRHFFLLPRNVIQYQSVRPKQQPREKKTLNFYLQKNECPTTKLIFLWHKICEMRAKHSIRFYFEYTNIWNVCVSVTIICTREKIGSWSLDEAAQNIYYNFFFIIFVFVFLFFCVSFTTAIIFFQPIFEWHLRKRTTTTTTTMLYSKMAHTSWFLFD